MSSAEITIIKRDGKRKAFSVEKIKNAIRKAFLSVGAFATEEDMVNILSHVRISEGMHVEDIQNQVEVGLFSPVGILAIRRAGVEKLFRPHSQNSPQTKAGRTTRRRTTIT